MLIYIYIYVYITIGWSYDCTIVVYSSGDNMSTSLATTQYCPALLRFHTRTSPYLKILHSVTPSTVKRFLVRKNTQQRHIPFRPHFSYMKCYILVKMRKEITY